MPIIDKASAAIRQAVAEGRDDVHQLVEAVAPFLREEWVPVGERLPGGEARRMLVMLHLPDMLHRRSLVDQAWWDDADAEWYAADSPIPKIVAVTHWQELPEPPKE